MKATTNKLRKYGQAYLLLLPSLVFLLFFTHYPVIYSVWTSFFDRIRGENRFVGVANYLEMFTSVEFQQAIVNNIIYALCSTIPAVVLGLFLAVLLNTKIKAKGLFTVSVLLPMMMTPIAVGLFWRILFNRQWGLINYFIGLLGFDPVPWLYESGTAFAAVCFVQIWWGVSFVILVLLGGLSLLLVG